MMLYHGSYVEIKEPSLSFSRDNLDFEKGFYTTPIKEQAEKWAQRFQRRGKNGIISVYSIDEAILNSDSVLKFESYSEEWIDISNLKGASSYECEPYFAPKKIHQGC